VAAAPERDRRHGRRPAEPARGLVVYLIGEHVRQQSVKVLFRQRCKLQKASVQPLQLAFRHRVEVDTANALLGTRSLQPTKQNLGSTGIRDCAFAQTTFDLGVTGRFTDTASSDEGNSAGASASLAAVPGVVANEAGARRRGARGARRVLVERSVATRVSVRAGGG
jgi:hypothetical protein